MSESRITRINGFHEMGLGGMFFLRRGGSISVGGIGGG